MAALRLLIVVGVCLYFSYGTVAQQCDQAIQDFHQCLGDAFKKPSGSGSGGQAQGRPNFDELKQKADQCFTSNNCEAPKLGGPPSPGSKPEGGPQGGRAGRVGGSNANGDNSDRRKCFESVNNKTKDAVLSCIRKTDPSFNFPTKGGDNHGPGVGFGGPRPGGFGGDHDGPQGAAGGPGRGGAGGAGGGPGRGGPGGRGQQFLLDACKNNADAANKVNACLANVFPHPPQRPSNDQAKQAFEAHCQAKSACEAKLGASCKSALEQRRQAMCKCGQEAAAKRQELQQQEPACANVQQGQAQKARQGGKGRQQHDCSKAPEDRCALGFDASLQQAGGRHN